MEKVGRFSEIARYTDLLQSGEIESATEISHPQRLGKKDLKGMYSLAKKCSSSHDFNAIAYTQFPDIFFDYSCASKEFKNIIYFGDKKENQDLRELLVINPDVKIADNDTEKYISIEGCGSVGMGKIQMAIERPKNITLSGFFWKDKFSRPQPGKINLSDWPSAMVQHEVDHLGGKTALSFPERILDILSLEDVILHGVKLDNEAWKGLLKTLSVNKGYKYLTNQEGKLTVTSSIIKCNGLG